MVPQLNKVKNIPVRFKQFNDMANKLKVDLDVIPEVIGDDSTTVSTIGEAVKQGDLNRAVDVISQRDANMEVNAPEIGTTGLGSQDTEVGTKENPYDTPRTAAEFDRIPIGGLFIGLNGEIRTKRKERNK